ncbi:MAG: TrmH family RNA methyltransferase [Burkholderiaceae bacterium]|jgi:TrmH family RNA methyltransferase
MNQANSDAARLATITKEIRSRKNPHIKLLKDLVMGGRLRRSHNAAWVEGERLCRSYFDTQTSLPILVASEKLLLADVVASAPRGIQSFREVWTIPADCFSEITQIESSLGWGLVIEVPIPSGSNDDLSNNETQLSAGRKALMQSAVVIVDRIQDPGNLGALLRSAAAAGIAQCWCITGTVDPWSPKVLRAAMGAHFQMTIRQGVNAKQAIDACRLRGFHLLSTANQPDAVSLYSAELQLNQPIAWVFGQEGDGVAQEFLSQAQVVVIPQTAAVESLNVAVAAGICFFEMCRRQTLA